MQFAERHFEFFRDMQSDGSHDGMPLLVEGIERPPESVVVHLLDRKVPEDVGSAGFSPLRNVGQRDGRIQSRGDKRIEYRAMIKLRLHVCRDVLVDNLFEFDSFEPGRNHGQLSKVTAFNIFSVSIARLFAHALSLAGSASLVPLLF